MKFFQKLGKSLMLPVCVLPICGILMGIGYALCPGSMQGGEISGTMQVIGYLMVKAGGAVIDNMSVLFVIGVAIGMSEDGHGSAALSGIVSWLVITTLLSTNVVSVVDKAISPDSTAWLAFSKIKNPTVGMIAGLIGAGCYNRFKSTRLPDFLAFFSGRRSVSVVTVLVSFLAAVALAFLWPVCFGGMVTFGRWVAALGGAGSGIYAFLNRLLIPTGMHHALNNVFWFDTIGLGDLTNFWKGKTSQDVGWSLGMYMSGFFPCMIGGLPGAALAMYHCAKNKKKALGVLFSTAFCAFLCGLTEPFEFSFMFLCFPLYVAYSVLFGIFSVISYFTGFRAGFSFSAGLVDLVFSSSLPAAANTWMILPLSIAAFAAFYAVFRFAIQKFDLPTIGREDDFDEEAEQEGGSGTGQKSKKAGASAGEEELERARDLLKAVGGKDNVVSTDCCATRLRLELRDSSVVNKKLAVSRGAIGVICPSKTSCQLIIGTTVQQMLEAFRTALSETPAQAEGQGKPVESAEKTETGKLTGSREPSGPVIPHGQIIRIPLKKQKTAEKCVAAGNPAGTVPADIPLTGGEDGSVSFSYIIRDTSGIHARPAGQIAQIIKKYGVKAEVEANGKTASGTSPVQMMGLGAKQNTQIRMKISGDPDSTRAAAEEVSRFIGSNL